jgi:hypothetical protein
VLYPRIPIQKGREKGGGLREGDGWEGREWEGQGGRERKGWKKREGAGKISVPPHFFRRGAATVIYGILVAVSRIFNAPFNLHFYAALDYSST